MSSQRNRWKTLREILFYPWIILLFIGTLLLTSILLNQTNVILIATSAFLISLFSGVLGGIVAKRLDTITEEKLIIAKGNSAYSSLQLLLSSVISLERRVRLYRQRYIDKEYNKKINPEVINTYFEEVIDECVSLEEKVINSIEDWTDILPNVEIMSVLYIIRELKIEFNAESAHLEHVNNELKEIKNKSMDEMSELNKGRIYITEELSRIRKELLKKSAQIGVPSISESLIAGENFVPTTGSNVVNPESGSKLIDGKNERKYPIEDDQVLPPKKTTVKKPDGQIQKRKYKKDPFSIFRD
jgi:hypothetical protein